MKEPFWFQKLDMLMGHRAVVAPVKLFDSLSPSASTEKALEPCAAMQRNETGEFFFFNLRSEVKTKRNSQVV